MGTLGDFAIYYPLAISQEMLKASLIGAVCGWWGGVGNGRDKSKPEMWRPFPRGRHWLWAREIAEAPIVS